MPGGDSRDGSHAPTLSAVQDELVWIDCEMTGLDLGSDKLIEIAALVTDADLNILGDGVDVVMHADDAALSGMIDVVAEMHSRSGLIDEVKASTVDLATAEAMVLDYINEHVKQPKTAPLAGNSIATDRAFIARDMPTLDSFLHYRMIDVSSIKELCRRWYPRIYFAAAQGADAPGAGRHPRIHPRTAVLPPHRVRAPARPFYQRNRGRRRRAFRRGGRAGRNRFGRGAPERLISTSPLISPRGGGRRPW